MNFVQETNIGQNGFVQLKPMSLYKFIPKLNSRSSIKFNKKPFLIFCFGKTKNTNINDVAPNYWGTIDGSFQENVYVIQYKNHSLIYMGYNYYILNIKYFEILRAEN